MHMQVLLSASKERIEPTESDKQAQECAIKAFQAQVDLMIERRFPPSLELDVGLPIKTPEQLQFESEAEKYKNFSNDFFFDTDMIYTLLRSVESVRDLCVEGQDEFMMDCSGNTEVEEECGYWSEDEVDGDSETETLSPAFKRHKADHGLSLRV